MLIPKNWLVSTYTDATWTNLVSEPATLATLVLTNTTDTDVVVEIQLVDDVDTKLSTILPTFTLSGYGAEMIDVRSINVLHNQKIQVKADVAGAEFTASGVINTEYVPSESVNVSADPLAFYKTKLDEPAFKLDTTNVRVNGDLKVMVNGELKSYEDDTLIAPASYVAGRDYAIYATTGLLTISEDFTFPAGYTAETSRLIGGFHYGDGAINPYSIYDLRYRPDCPDARGMAKTPEGVWADIYLLNTTPDLLGTSAYLATIADKEAPPKIPAAKGGDGTEVYPDWHYIFAQELLACYGKRLPTYSDFMALAYGAPDDLTDTPIDNTTFSGGTSNIGCQAVVSGRWQMGAEIAANAGSLSLTYGNIETNGGGDILVQDGSVNNIMHIAFGGGVNPGASGSKSFGFVSHIDNQSVDMAVRGVCDHTTNL